MTVALSDTDAVNPGGALTALGLDEAPSSTRYRRSLGPAATVAAVIAVGLIIAAVFAPLIAPYAPNAGVTAQRLGGFGKGGHLLGTDGEGRDVLSRLIWGARLSLLTGFIPVAIAGTVGTALGVIAGLAGKRVHGTVMRTLDVFYAFPAVLLAITIAAALGSGVSNSIIALTVILIPPIARVAETETARLRRADFLEAATASGARRSSVAIRQVLPNVGPAITVYCTTLVGLSIVYAAGLSFLGLGVSPPTAEWGLMISDARQYIYTAPLIALAPAVAILGASVVFNVLGDGLRQLLDVRSERFV
jgi:peptide/nickel transport system permease protein